MKTATNIHVLYKLIEEMTSPLSPFETDLQPHLDLPKGIKAILFDIYGTLLISGTGDISIAEEKENDFPIVSILEKSGIKMLSSSESVDERFAELMKDQIRKDHQKKKEQGIDYPEVDIREIWQNIIEILKVESYTEGHFGSEELEQAALSYECLVNPVWAMPGAKKLLNRIYDSSLKSGIVSNAQFYTEPILEKLLNFQTDPDNFPRELIFYSFEQNEAKPSVVFFSKAVNKLKKMYNINPDEILYLGNDMLNDVFTASQCGCRTALFAGDKRSLRLRRSDERCRDLKPDLIVTHLDQLTEIL